MKTRLVGAAVLIALAVIFVPMLLPSGSDPDRVALKIPPPPTSELQTRILEVGPDSASAGSSTSASVTGNDRLAILDADGASDSGGNVASPTSTPSTALPDRSAAVATTSSTGAPAASVAKPEVAEADKAVPAPAATASAGVPVAGGAGAAAGVVYSVNLGIYANQASAAKLVASAQQHGFTALATAETFQGKPVSRVRVGPFASRAEAEAARLKLKGFEPVASMTVEATAIDQKGDAPASALPATQPGAWAVQLAAFSDEGSADKLRDRLRDLGFDGYVDSVATSGGKLWRVRAGPFASREVATRTREQIASRMKITGNIVTEH